MGYALRTGIHNAIFRVFICNARNALENEGCKWWCEEMNLLFYGPDPAVNAREARKALGAAVVPVLSTTASDGTAPLFYERRFRTHYEYDFNLVYNAAALRTCIDNITAVARLRRIDGCPLNVVLFNLQALGVDDRAYIKTLVDDYSDRTRFLITTTSFSAAPRGIVGICLPVRVPAPLPCTQELEAALMRVLASRQPRKEARALAYACCNNGTPLALLCRAAEELGGDIAMITACESMARRCKRDVMAWEALLNGLLAQVQKGVRGRRTHKGHAG